MLSSIGNLADRIICVVFAILFAQVPVYINQYVDVLSGAQMESGKVHQELEEAASNYNLRIPEYLDKLGSNPDPMVRDNIAIQKNAEDRYQRYTRALTDLTERNMWVRPFYLIQHYDSSIHAAMHFEANFPFTPRRSCLRIRRSIVCCSSHWINQAHLQLLPKKPEEEKRVVNPTQ